LHHGVARSFFKGHKETLMNLRKPVRSVIHLSTGESFPILENQEHSLFLAVLGQVLARDYLSPCKLRGWGAVCLECERELQFIAGQLHASGQMPSVERLRDEFCCWQDELIARLSATRGGRVSRV
jgi:hypothetical protein